MKHITNIKNKISGFSWALALFLGLAWPVMGQTTYTWNTTTGSWSTSSNWTTAGPGSTYPGSLDTATINNLTANSTITLDTGVSGVGAAALTNLNMIQSSSATVTTSLSLAKSLSVSGTVLIDDTLQTSGNSNNILNLGGNTLTVNNLTLGSTSDQAAWSSFSSWINGGSTSALTVNGTLSMVNVSTSGLYFTIGANSGAPVATTINGTLDFIQNTTGGGRYYQNGTFTAGNGSTIEATSANGHASSFGGIELQGATNTIGTSVTFSGITSGNITFFDQNFAAQSITANTPFQYTIRDALTGSSSTPVTATQTYTNSTTGNAVDQLLLQNGTAYSTQIFKLGSNLVLNSTEYSPFYFTSSTANAGSSTKIDLAGFSYDATAATATGWTPSSSSSNQTSTVATSNPLIITNSSTSSIGSTIAASHGLLAATAFNLSNVDMAINSGVILQATGMGGTNNLGQISGGTQTINAGSTFYYTGTGTASTLTSSRSIGGLIVGNGAAASTLKLASAITAAGNVTSAASSTLDLNNQSLALSGASNLIGGGTIANTGGTASGNPIAFGTGGLTPGGGIAGATTATLTLNSAVGVTLNSGTTSTFNLASTSAYDKVSGGTFTLAGALDVDLMTGFSAGSGATFNLFSGSALSGGFADASSVMLVGNPSLDAAYTATFNNSTGVLTVSSVPEPGTGALFVLGAMALGVAHLRKRQSSI